MVYLHLAALPEESRFKSDANKIVLNLDRLLKTNGLAD